MKHAAGAIVIGAGPAGLACAACLRQAGFEPLILEKADTVGSTWRRHYERLHLHSAKRHSELPGLAMPRLYPHYPSRLQMVDYLERYARHFQLAPRFGVNVRSLRRQGAAWEAKTDAGTLSAPVVVVATGWADSPHRPTWPGMGDFGGKIMHSTEYRRPGDCAGGRALVVGFGNSGAEIALDLAQAGVDVTLAVRGAVQIVPRDLFGVSILTWAITEAPLPPRLADFINRPAIRWAIGPTADLGLALATKGPLQMIAEDRRVPLLDAGTLAKIRSGAIAVRGGIERFTRSGVVFADGTGEVFSSVVLATGFRPDLRRLLPDEPALFDAQGLPNATGRPSGAEGLFFCGQIASATGQLREIGLEARRIARFATVPARAREALINSGERQGVDSA